MKKNYKETYFQHDRYARQDPKIKDMLVHFRKESELKAQAAICIFWWIVEDMHIDDYPISKLAVFADDYRCDISFLKSILEDFGLFRQENGCYVSNRVLRNLKEQEEKNEKARQSAKYRWHRNKSKDEQIQELSKTDIELIDSIIQIFNTEFKRTQIVGKENQERIFKIHKENSLTLDIWQKVFKNAKRGWDIDGKNKKPNLKTILDKWDLFASDDYYLAYDKEEAHKIENEKKKQAELEEEKQKNELIEKINLIQTKKEAINYLSKHCIKKRGNTLVILDYLKPLIERFNIDEKEILEGGKIV